MNPQDEKISEAMETVFPMLAEDAFMSWHGVDVALSYKYTLSWMIEDIMLMLEEIIPNDAGTFSVRWPVQELAATWIVEWSQGRVQVSAEWETTPRFTGILLRDRPKRIECDIREFLAEWKLPLGTIIQALRSAGYGEEHLFDMSRLQAIHDAIPRPGLLYRDEIGGAQPG